MANPDALPPTRILKDPSLNTSDRASAAALMWGNGLYYQAIMAGFGLDDPAVNQTLNENPSKPNSDPSPSTSVSPGHSRHPDPENN